MSSRSSSPTTRLDRHGQPIRPEDSPRPVAAGSKGRGTGVAIAHRFASVQRKPVDDGWGADDQLVEQEELPPSTEVTPEQAGSILARNDSPDVPFEWSVNPYRGCEHGCIYCYARPTHGYLDLSPGLDFETRIVAKVNAAQRLEQALGRRGHVVSPINIGSVTDAYQPAERRLRITRAVLEVLLKCRHPFTIVTKSAGPVRDLDLLGPAAAQRLVQVFISVTTLDPALARILEPRAAAPHRRLEAIAALAAAGVPVAMNVAPIIPFINEPEIEQIVEAGAAVGARSVHYTTLRLPWEVAPLFKDWLLRHFPERAERVLGRVRDLHGGRDYDADFATRMRGRGPWADLIHQRIYTTTARHGLTREAVELDTCAFVPPAPRARPADMEARAQGSLF